MSTLLRMFLAACLTLLFCQPALAQSRDPIAERVQTILAGMSMEQKVGQLFLVSFQGSRLPRALRRMLTEQFVGGVVLFNSSRNIVTAKQTAQLVNDMQQVAVENGAKIPLFVAIDEEGGDVTRLPTEATWFPSAMALGATGSQDYARAMARVVSNEMKALGLNMNLAPVLDVNDNVLNPIIGTRAMGASADLVSLLGEALVGEYERNGILAVAKHFPGHGGASLDSHSDLPLINRSAEDVQANYVQPFARAVRAGVDVIMTAHVVFNALDPNAPATLSPKVLQGELRAKLRYDGLIMSDALWMRALTKDRTLNDVAILAFKAGVDILAISSDLVTSRTDKRTVYQAVLEAVQTDPALQRHLDDSVRRILTAKARYGILDWRPVTFDPSALGKPEARSVARQIALASVTLARNRGQLVPIAPEAKVLLVLPNSVGDLAKPLRACKKSVTVARVRVNPTAREVQAVARRATQFDVVVVATLNVATNTRQADLVNELTGQRLIVAAMQSPYDLLSFPGVAAYLTAYSNVPYSLDALAEVLCGQSAPVGVPPVPL